MGSTRVTIMLITMTIVMVMGNFVAQTQAQDTHSFRTFTCLFTCLAPPTSNISPPHSQMILTKEINHIDYFCKLGCATHHCASLSSLRNPNVGQVADCVDSCSDKCSNKN
ncbi:thionin-like protein 2 isoform X2 [Raphanus sativus]|uniref:Thionin-like protein 2 isoform X2 n=1 Tax=Raphanus sativus TaxID=3726 RepID=A0A9W3BZJ7_RAPSA|nr:thionin-like protein 2 isoform X2 [Raphanus sativus]